MKPVAAYSKLSAASDGLSPYCRDCRKQHKIAGAEKAQIARKASRKRRLTHYRAKNNEWSKEARRKNPEKHRKYHREYNRVWDAEHPEKRKEYSRRWYFKDITRARALALASYHRNVDKNREALRLQWSEKSAKRRSSLILCDLTLTQWEELLEAANYCCTYCGIPFDEATPPEKDHKFPVKRGGQHTKANVTPACKSCNSSKKDKTQEEYYEYLQQVALHASSVRLPTNTAYHGFLELNPR